ncbi:MAG: RnfABCDGE type electron transport complex subunit D [Treponema sp.]|jgi:electron transport complex protein RnfD|nr:RnfABCDGE type electron transport complex subunit D [Treponema sp.]
MASIIEEKTAPPAVFLASSPHIASPVDAQRLMANALISLAPCSIYGAAIFGLPALLTIVVSMGAAIGAEALFRRLIKRDIRIKDLSAALTGLLLALVLPPSTPLWMTALGAVFAIIVVKEFFGGLGANVFNPALAGRAFLIMSFPAAITTWHRPPGGFALSLPDTLSGATPLGAARSLSGAEAIAAVGNNFANPIAGADYAAVMQTLFLGNHAGCIGETSILLILLGAAYLLITQTIDWRAPAAMLAMTTLASAILGIDPLFALLSGGVVFGAVFMATDYVTAPLTAVGKLMFGAGAGLITVLIRKWGSFPEGVTYGLLIMNAVAPFLDHFIQKKYGFAAKPKKAVKP